ncbi:ABC transporter permease [Agromyces archimandritae]|uniref:ABC transporter permease n=1 Tax=Agromyces archimandritae TaxID=2781962 RepID=A0A975IPA7_9MICO|nr:ABC transporter permease [Agromyces archimandritae]QTX05390.1 ABC transporter permease [Agromyces archimandritae]
MTAAPASAPARIARPGPRSWLVLMACEAKMVARDTAGLIVPLGMPLLILVMSAQSAASEPVGGLTALEVFVLPLVFTVVIASIGVINMPSFLAYYRRSGILRRLAVTPASPAMVLVAQAVVSLAQALVGISVAFAVAVFAFGARPPLDPVGAAMAVALGIAAMYAVGMLVAALAPTPNSAVAIGLVAFFALGALGGLFGGMTTLPEPLAAVGEVLPFGASVQALSAAWAGWPIEPASLIALSAATLVCGGAAAAAFRWE